MLLAYGVQLLMLRNDVDVVFVVKIIRLLFMWCYHTYFQYGQEYVMEVKFEK